MKRSALLLLAFFALSLHSQTNLKEIIRLQSEIASTLNSPVEGFAVKLSGEDITYHSTRQDCPTALLVRATDGRMEISWETPPVQVKAGTEKVQLFLIAGMSLQGYGLQGVDPGFRVFVNDTPYFSFGNSMGPDWAVEGPGGSRMMFRAVIRDQANDGFGYARIELPVTLFKAGNPLKIRIVGDDSGSRHWFMVFQCTDALDWFRKKTDTDAWLDLAIQRSGNRLVGTLKGSGAFSGKKIEVGYSGQSAIQVGLPGNGPAEASFTLSGRAGRIFLKGPLGLNIPDIEIDRTYNKSLIEKDRLVSWQVTTGENGSARVEVQAAQSDIHDNLRQIADSEIARGKIHIIASSHQDIAWMDSPQACVEDRDNLLITPALAKLQELPAYYNDMEDILMLREYLTRHPEKKQEIYDLTKDGRLTWGASFIQPYEEMYFGEPLVRQFYLGRKWFRKEFPGCDASIYWNVDVPGRTLQMPQILEKSGVPYMIISRHDKGLFHWLAPDGSSVLTYSPDHYYNSWVNLKKGFFESVNHIADLTRFWSRYYPPTTLNPVMPVLSDADMAVPDSYFDYIDTWNSLRDSSLQLPVLEHSNALNFFRDAQASGADFPSIMGERPAVWLYIHGPSHYQALKAGRSAGRMLPAAEKMASLNAMISGDWSKYPQDRLTSAWESAIYPDHGWGGKNGDITDQTFLDKFREADQQAREIIDESTTSIASRIAPARKGLPLTVFNSLSWEREDPVVTTLEFPDRTLKDFELTDSEGKPVTVQKSGRGEFYPSGYLKRLEICFIASGVPSLGYKTYYVVPADRTLSWSGPASAEGLETEFYRVKMGRAGIVSLYDKGLGREVLNSDQFMGGELFSMHSLGNGAGEFADIQQPDMEGFEKPGVSTGWKVVDDGPVRTILSGETQMVHNKARMTYAFYKTLNRIDVRVDLIDWDGTAYREFRLAFPAGLQDPEISYEVPFGVVRVGKDELTRAAGERYTTPCSEVHPRGINNWISASDSQIGITISSSVAVWDYVNMTDLNTSATLLQPILLASRQSCHGEGPLYHQKGNHSMEFSVFTHKPGWKSGYKQALQANEQLFVVFNPKKSEPLLKDRESFFSVDDPHALISTIKKAEDDNALVIRLYDQEGRDKNLKVRFSGEFFNRIEQTNLLEEGGEPLKVDSGSFSTPLGHHAIETFKLGRQ